MAKKRYGLTLSTEERIKLAKEKIEHLKDRALGIVRQRASNNIVVYSDVLSKQVGRSYAAHAFQSLQRVMFQHELISVYALWDSVDGAKEKIIERDSIPAVIRLIDDPNIVKALVNETFVAHLAIGVRQVDPHEDPSLRAAVENSIENVRKKIAEERADEAGKQLKNAITQGKAVMEGELLKAVKHYRDKEIAHAIAFGTKEATIPDRRAKYGDERKLLEHSIEVLHLLSLGVSGIHFDWDESSKIEKRNAEALWHGVTIKVLK